MATFLLVESYGAISCATWIKTKHSSTETLCYGTGMGYLVFMRPNPVDNRFQEITARRLGTGLEITCVAWDASWIDAGAWIAIGMRDNSRSSATAQLQFATPVSICGAGSNIRYQSRSPSRSAGTSISSAYMMDCRGCAAVSLKKELVVIDNATNGFTLYPLDREDPIRYFVTEPQSVPIPKQVAFGEESKIIVGGSDNGSVYLFERRTGRMLAKLAHSKTGLVQTITVRRDIFAFFLP
ncbi:hypothetical protein EDD16DRAFT_1514952 [Pisolithus croceorrhizus]|nr:hypothetical protein EDD16DRAFT_1514952 [Pisolithus croceorrhizus]